MRRRLGVMVLVSAMLAASACHPARQSWNRYVRAHDDLAAEATPPSWHAGSEWTLVARDDDGATDTYRVRVTHRASPDFPGHVELDLVASPSALWDAAVARVDGRNLQIQMVGADLHHSEIIGGELIDEAFVGVRRRFSEFPRSRPDYAPVEGRRTR